MLCTECQPSIRKMTCVKIKGLRSDELAVEMDQLTINKLKWRFRDSPIVRQTQISDWFLNNMCVLGDSLDYKAGYLLPTCRILVNIISFNGLTEIIWCLPRTDWLCWTYWLLSLNYYSTIDVTYLYAVWMNLFFGRTFFSLPALVISSSFSGGTIQHRIIVG